MSAVRLKIAMALLALVLAHSARGEDTRPLATLPPAAQETLRQEMLDNLLAVNEILELVAVGKITEAGAVAEAKLGRAAMGRHRDKPFEARPGPNMPPAMHRIGMEGHVAASEFAAAAATGDRDKALALLPRLTGNCVACHYAWRTR